jgi:hypothetical protein
MSGGELWGEMRRDWLRRFHALRSFPRKRDSRATHEASGILLLGSRSRGDERRNVRCVSFRCGCQTAGAGIRASAIAPVICGAGCAGLPLAPRETREGSGAPKSAAVYVVPRSLRERGRLSARHGGDFGSRARVSRCTPLRLAGPSARRLITWTHVGAGERPRRPVQRSSSRKGHNAQRAGSRDLPGAGLRTPRAGAASHPALVCVS